MTSTRYLQQNRRRHLGELQELLSIPSVSTDPERAEDVKRAAAWVAGRLDRAGCTRVKVHPTKRHPIVYGEWIGAPGKPTILVYGHYDVQPVDPLDLWNTDPFKPTVKNGRLYARGASDDKGQVIIHVNALEAHLVAEGECPVNVKFLIEGEEEIGSPNLVGFIAKNKKLLACDAVVVSDTAMFAKGRPSICYGLRGMAYVQITVTGTNRDLHSGTFGGAVVNPANALVAILDTLKDKNGKIKIKGFYDNVARITPSERKAFAALPHSDTRFRQSIGAPALAGERGYSTLERLWCRPTLDINGIWGGFTGEGAKTVIPAVAHAKISMRLVPNQTPAEAEKKLARHLKSVAPRSVRVEVQSLHGGEAWLAPTDHPAMLAASRAMQRAFGRKAVFVREGGSIPIVATFDKLLDVPCVLMGIGLQDDNLHAPNEKIDLDQFYRGIEAAAYLMEEIGAQIGDRPAAARPKKEAGTQAVILRRALMVLVLGLNWTGAALADDDAIFVSSAISLREPLVEAIDLFSQRRHHDGGIAFEVQLGGSATLAQQIRRGAPTDVFLSASPQDTRRLTDAGLARDVCALAGNRLVVVVGTGIEPPLGLDGLADERFERIAVANPRTAPLGRYTEQVLEDAGLLPVMGARLIPAEHARQVVDYVARGEVDSAIVYATDANRFKDRVTRAFLIAADRHDPIVYQAAMISKEPSAEASAFLEFLCSESGGVVFETHGFTRWFGPR